MIPLGRLAAAAPSGLDSSTPCSGPDHRHASGPRARPRGAARGRQVTRPLPVTRAQRVTDVPAGLVAALSIVPPFLTRPQTLLSGQSRPNTPKLFFFLK